MLNFEWEKIGEKKFRMSDGGEKDFGCRIADCGKEMINVECQTLER